MTTIPLSLRKRSGLATASFVLGCLSLASPGLVASLAPIASRFDEQFLDWAIFVGMGVLPLVLSLIAISSGFAAWLAILRSHGRLKGRILATLGIVAAIGGAYLEFSCIRLAWQFEEIQRVSPPPSPPFSV